MEPKSTASVDDKVTCGLCGDTLTIRVWADHMARKHGWGKEEFQAVADAPIVDVDERTASSP